MILSRCIGLVRRLCCVACPSPAAADPSYLVPRTGACGDLSPQERGEVGAAGFFAKLNGASCEDGRPSPTPRPAPAGRGRRVKSALRRRTRRVRGSDTTQLTKDFNTGIRPRRSARSGLTLIEVLLALVILVIALVAIIRLVDIGTDRGNDARVYTRGARLAQAKMAEV